MFEATRAEATSVRAPLRANTLHVLTVPSRHPYIKAITPGSVKPVAVERTINWEPDPIFEPGAVARFGDIDVVHVHFSFDHLDVPAMRAWLGELDIQRVALVLTVHDLRNPHHKHRVSHDALLAELVPAAAAVITLTRGAADEIAARFGIKAHVIPHPTLVDPARSASVATETGLVALNLKYLRQNLVDPVAIVEAAAAGAADAGGRLLVNVLPKVLDPSTLSALDQVLGIELDVRPPFSDEELERYVRRAHAMVLPYRWGTHSGWLELARDLGTRIIAPDCGYFQDQWADVVNYTNNEAEGFDAVSLRKAVAYALQNPPPVEANHVDRVAEAAAARREHEAIYRQILR